MALLEYSDDEDWLVGNLRPWELVVVVASSFAVAVLACFLACAACRRFYGDGDDLATPKVPEPIPVLASRRALIERKRQSFPCVDFFLPSPSPSCWTWQPVPWIKEMITRRRGRRRQKEDRAEEHDGETESNALMTVQENPCYTASTMVRASRVKSGEAADKPRQMLKWNSAIRQWVRHDAERTPVRSGYRLHLLFAASD